MASVHAAVELSSGKALALKRLSRVDDQKTLTLFEREYQTLAGLRHPSVVEVYGYGLDAEGPFYTMELIDGSDLSQAAPMPWREVCRLLRDTASALGLLHARHLLHRDLSPRNLLRTRAGKLKLIDFGALTPYGPSSSIVGTPPFVAPEALRGLPLDQRADVFGLGALAYWLLTGVNAFPAKRLGELPALWALEPARVSEVLSRQQDRSEDPVPEELDQLLASMLRVDLEERLRSCADVVDRLTRIGQLESEAELITAQGYFDSRAYIGRERDRDRALALLEEARQGRVRSLVIQGERGIGRSRFMRQLAIGAAMVGAIPMLVSDHPEAKPFGVAGAVLLGLRRTLPDQTTLAASVQNGDLGLLWRSLFESAPDSTRPLSSPSTTPVQRLRLMTALREVIRQVARDQTLVFLVDDVQDIDEESLALLSSLAYDENLHLLLVFSLPLTSRSVPHMLERLCEKSVRLLLPPLSQLEFHELLRSVFGDARYLERLTERLHEICEGNPAHCLEVAQHLVQIGQATYRDGSWSLPTELRQESLPKERHLVQLATLEHLRDDVRAAARHLSVVQDMGLTLDDCRALLVKPVDEVAPLLEELEHAGVLRATGGVWRFKHEGVRAALCLELHADSRAQGHLRIAQKLAESATSTTDRLRACLHFMSGGDTQRAYVLLRGVLGEYPNIDLSRLRTDAPVLESIYRILRERKQDDYGTAGVLALLAECSHLVARSYGERYGAEALAVHRRLLRLALAERLQRFLGARAALLLALAYAGVGLWLHRDRARTLKQTVQDFILSATSLAGSAATGMDPAGVERYASAISPLRALGENHAATAAHEMVACIIPMLHDRPARASRVAREFLAKMEGHVRGLPETAKAELTAGALTVLGTMARARDDDACLAIASRLEQHGPLNAMQADQIRACFYGVQGDLERAGYFFARLESHAVQLGTSLQVEAWAATPSAMIAHRLADVAMMKRAAVDLERLSREIPTLARMARQTRGLYLLLLRDYQGAIEVLESDQGSPVIGWTRVRGGLAEAYNALGRHAEARATCLEAIERSEPDDFEFVAQNLNVLIQLALADAGLGELAGAMQRLDDLLLRHTPRRGPLTLGALHLARARVSLLAGDTAGAREHLGNADAFYRPTGAGGLLDHLSALRRELDRMEHAQSPGSSEAPARASLPPRQRTELSLRSTVGRPLEERARHGLQLLLEHTAADDGFVVLAGDDHEPNVIAAGESPGHDLVSWARMTIDDWSSDEQTLSVDAADAAVDVTAKQVGPVLYRAVVLPVARGVEEQLVGAIVLAFEGRAPCLPDASVVRALANHLDQGER